MPADRSFTRNGGLLFDGTPKAAKWNPPPFYIQNPAKPRANVLITPGALAFNAEVRDHPYVGMFLEMAGEILPILLENGEPLSVLNVTECVNALDSQRAEFRLDPSTKARAAIARYAFHADGMTQSPIFKIPETRRAEVLTFSGRFACAEDEFVSVFRQTKLTGIKVEPIWSGSPTSMYQIESGRSAFWALLRQLEKRALALAGPRTPVSVGIVMGAQNGGLGLSFECELRDGRPKHDNPAEMDFAFVGDYGAESSPMKEWSGASRNGISLLSMDGSVASATKGSYMFSKPIFDAVCRWTEDFFLRPDAEFSPVWLMVDEADAGMFRMWKLGKLAFEEEV